MPKIDLNQQQSGNGHQHKSNVNQFIFVRDRIDPDVYLLVKSETIQNV